MSINKLTRHCVLLFAALLAVNSYSQNSVTFNVNNATIVIPPGIYGILMERLGRLWTGTNNSGIFVGTSSTIPNTNGMRKDVIDGFKECGVTAAEWPGGCAANGYNWSQNKRPANDVGVDRFIEFCRLTGSEAVLVGKSTGNDAASNLAFCQYVVDSLKYPLKWFKVGNEVWGCGGNQNAATYTGNYSTNYDRLKDYFAAKQIKIIASVNYGGDQNWMTTMLNTLNGKIDGFEIHQYIYHPDDYSSTNPTTNQYWDVVRAAYNGMIGDNCKRMTTYLNGKDPNNKIKLIFDEWGDWFIDVGDGWEQANTLLDAISAAQHLHAFMESPTRVEVTGLAQAVNVIHSIMNINTNQVMVKTPTFYVFKMFIPHHTNSAKQAPVTASSWRTVNGNVQAVSAYASVDNAGIVNISMNNVDMSATQAVTVTLTSNAPSYVVKSAEVITGAAINTVNPYGGAEQINIKPLASTSYSLTGKTLTVTLPSKSVAMIRLEPPVAVHPGSIKKTGINSFTVKAGADRKVLVTSSVRMNSPVTVSLHGVDGRTITENNTARFDRDNAACVLGNKVLSRGVYLVRIKGENLNLTQQVVISK